MKLEFVRYCRAKSSAFGNAASRRNIRLAWRDTKSFLDTYTEYYLPIQPYIELWCADNGIPKEILERITERYGETDTEGGTPYRWYLPKELDEDTVSLAFENENYEKPRRGPVILHLPFSFKWKNIASNILDLYKDVFEYFYKGAHGQFSLILSDRLFIQSEYVIPYAIDSLNFSEFVASLRSSLPYKLSDNSMVAFESHQLKNGRIKYKAVGTLKSANITSHCS
jgi:hypothetical protein